MPNVERHRWNNALAPRWVIAITCAGPTDAQQLGQRGGTGARLRGCARFSRLQQIARDPQLAPKQRTSLQSLSELVDRGVDGELVDTAGGAAGAGKLLVEQGKSHPAGVLEGAQERLRRIGDNGVLAPDAASVVRRQIGALEKCSKSINAAIFKLNQPQFDAAIEKSVVGFRLESARKQLYRARDAASGAYGADSLDRAHRATLDDCRSRARSA